MSAATHAPLRSLVARDGVGLTANVVQHSTLRLSHIAVASPALILLRHGKKTLRAGRQQWRAGSGDAIVVAGGQQLDIVNQLSDRGLFEARWVVWDSSLLDEVRPLGHAVKPLTSAAVLHSVGDAFAAAVDRAVQAICNPADIPTAVARHQLAELLLWLAGRGISLAARQPSTTVARLRGLLAPALDQDWTLATAAERLATSQATLRRRLQAEGATFGEVLADARMSSALVLLQSTDRAVAHIAADVGYASASRFAVRFRARFGFAPTAVRGHRR